MQWWKRLEREIVFVFRLLRTLLRISPVNRRPTFLACDAFEAAVDRHRDALALRFEGRDYTFAQIDAIANAAAAWAEGVGLKRGDKAAIFLPNRAEYVPIWMGLTKIGVAGALINTNLTGATLAHCLALADSDHVIADAACLPAFQDVAASLARPMRAWNLDAGELALDAPAPRPDPARRQGLTNRDTALYIYTSGTTGMPKAARITHARALLYMLGFAGATGAKAEDRIYIALPLYHATGGLCAMGGAWLNGAAIVLRRRFSASAFWSDVVENGATMFVYIGELCRYLVNHPPHPEERAHRLRLAFGNGLRPDIWEAFQARFAVPRILEFYGATEGNVSLFNFDARPGAVGRVPFYLRSRFNVRIIAMDLETEQPLRGPDGLCVECKPGEIGEVIGQIGSDARTLYVGYADKAASEKKVLRGVFKPGDAFFRTGDLMRQDEDGYLYFVDRLGDTFRWKAENVSTTEVAHALGSFPGVLEANVYGVRVGQMDGRAGMAAITAPGIDLHALRAHLATALPGYARPVFLRLTPQIETTGTFKYRKVDLVRDGFDPTRAPDPVFFDHPAEKRYVPVTPELYAQIESGGFRL